MNAQIIKSAVTSHIQKGDTDKAFQVLLDNLSKESAVYQLAVNYQKSYQEFWKAVRQGVLSSQEQEVKRSYFTSVLLGMVNWIGLSKVEICQQLLEKRKKDGELAMFLSDLEMVYGEHYLARFIRDYPDIRYVLAYLAVGKKPSHLEKLAFYNSAMKFLNQLQLETEQN